MRLISIARRSAPVQEALREVSLNAFLARLIWMCVLPLLILAAYLSIHHLRSIHSQHKQDASDRAHNAAASIDLHIEAQIAALKMLSASPSMDDPPNVGNFYKESLGFRENFSGHVILADTSMQMIFNTRTPFGTVLPKLPKPRGHAAAPEALATGRPAVGDMFMGPIAKEPLVAIVTPVIRDEQVRFLLLSIIEARHIMHHLEQIALPSGWRLTVLDGKDEVMTRRSSSETEALAEDDEKAIRIVVPSRLSHWSVVLEVSQSVYRGSIISSASTLAATLLAITLVSVLGGSLAGRRLARSVAALAQEDSSQVSGPVIAEVAAVRRLLDEAATARDAAQQTTLESEKRFRRLFDIAPVPLCVFNNEGSIMNFNARFRQTFGYEHEDIPSLAEWWRLAYPDPDYRRSVVAAWDKVVRLALECNSDIEPAEYRVTCKSGKVLTMEISGVGLGDDFLVTFFDITDRKQAEVALAHERNKFRRFLDALPVGVYIVDDHYSIEFVNPVMLSDFGPVDGRRCYEYFHERSEACPWCKNAEVLAGETVVWEWSSEKTGKTYDLIDTPVYGAEGRVSKLEVFFDITARKEAEKGLRRFELLAAHSRDIILFMRRDDGQILEANSAAVNAYGYSREELLAMTIHKLRAIDEPGLTAEQMAEADEHGILFETVHRRNDGSELPVEVSSRGATIHGARTLISVIRDITERKRSEMELHKSLEEKVALLKEVHHRVKNNLQIVVSLLGLQSYCTGNPEALEILKDTRNRVRTMALLHETLYRSGNLAHISFAAFIDDLCRQIVASFGRSSQRIRVETRVEAIGLPLDQAVPCGLIVNELVSNALKHAFPGDRSGSVMVRLERIGGEMLLLRVSDDGAGIPPHINPENASTLGLQLVSDLANQLCGSVTLDKPFEGGAIFSVVFPFHEHAQRGRQP